MKKMLLAISLLTSLAISQSIKFQDFSTYPTNKAGANYPNQYTPDGTGTYELDSLDGIKGKSLKMTVTTSGNLYAQFNAHNASGTRGFAHEYSSEPWAFDTYNRFEFWLKVPKNGLPLPTLNQNLYTLGTYVKTYLTPAPYTDESGNNHYYHQFNLPPNGYWSKIVFNHHPHHLRGGIGSTDWGVRTYPTSETGINYFDALTRFYIDEPFDSSHVYPRVFHLDEMRFWKEADANSDSLIYTLAASYGEGKLFFATSSLKSATPIWCEVRWSRKDIRNIGWNSASVAPNGRVKAGDRGYNGIIYQTDSLRFNVGDTVYLAIKPETSPYFAQIQLPILDSLGRSATVVPPPPPPTPIDTSKCVSDTVIREVVRVDSTALTAARDSIKGLSQTVSQVSQQLNIANQEIFGLRSYLISTRDSLSQCLTRKPDTVTIVKEIVRDTTFNFSFPSFQIQIKSAK